MKKIKRKSEPCPCGGTNYRNCCARFHKGERPSTPVELMKSRYSAYAKGLADYIRATTDPDGPAWSDEDLVESVGAFQRDFRFLGVDIIEHESDETTGMVKFRAKLERAGANASFEERSEFVHDGERWLYHAGVVG